MSPPAFRRAERTTHNVQITPRVAPLARGADGAARRPYQQKESPWDSTQMELKAALADARRQTKTRVIVIETDPEKRVPGYESWWDVPLR